MMLTQLVCANLHTKFTKENFYAYNEIKLKNKIKYYKIKLTKFTLI